ncbi:CinA family protein [Acinetobacter sp. CFCC 10889]|uniref:CinA family protein n=1 Tax=Acinetobacter sp. CFCC 10889 TaxID=1775557 RepID=UPI000DCFB019|nr:CinA family protein [Acinetobacter sp. CFCC 10889]
MYLKQCCDTLERKALKIAFIESASSGHLSAQFSIYKNSGADILLGGLVSYDPSIKIKILGIDPQLIKQYTAESTEVTTAMAIKGKILFDQADLIVSCTGLLKHGGSESKYKPVGTFYICINYLNQIHSFQYLIQGSAEEKLQQLTEQVAKEVLQCL